MSGALGPGSSRLHDRAELLPPRPLASTAPLPGSAHSCWTDRGEARLLVVDPHVADETLTTELATQLARWGVHVTTVASTIDGLVEYGRGNPAAVIVAPDAHGIPPGEFVKAVRRFGSPFIIAVMDQPNSRILGELIVAGGSAAIERPYTAMDVWGMLEGARHAFRATPRLSFGPLELDARAYSVTINGERIGDLPLKEFELLRTLMHRAPEVLADQEIRRELWGEGQINGNTLAVHVARLRHRLQGVARIRRIRGRGYSLALD